MVESKSNGIKRKYSSRAFQWMVISVCFDNLNFVGQFLFPTLGDRSHHQSLMLLPFADHSILKGSTALFIHPSLMQGKRYLMISMQPLPPTTSSYWSTTSWNKQMWMSLNLCRTCSLSGKPRWDLLTLWLKELNPRRRVYVEIPKPSRVELKCNTSGFDVILVTPERVLVSQHRPDAEDLISILKCLKAKSYVLPLPGRVLVSYQEPLHSERG
jgi:hypothetical protein